MEQMNKGVPAAPQENIENLPQQEESKSILEQLTEEELAELDRPEENDHLYGRR